MKYLSTFSGIGGFELGITQAYENTRMEHTTRQMDTVPVGQETLNSAGMGDSHPNGSSVRADEDKPTCIGFSEIDRYATQIYQQHFPDHKNYGDITKIIAEDLPDFDLLVGGFPCQSFSIAGKRGGFEDTRGTMFFELARILRAKQPRLFVFENVKGLLSHNNGNTFRTIISTLTELGYDLQWQVLNSKNHGVPQNRERVFIVGHLRGTSRPQVFPFLGTDEKDTRNCGEDLSYALDANYHKGTNTLEKNRRQVILHNTYGGFNEKKARVFENESPTIRTSAGGAHLPSVSDGEMVRRLTLVECERLQGFPDGWTEGVSDTQRYKCCGNAVTVNVVRDVCERLLQS